MRYGRTITNYDSSRLILKEFSKNDFSLFYSVFSNEEVMKYALMEAYCREVDALSYFNRILKNNVSTINRGAFEYGVYLIPENCFIGFADIEIHNKNVHGGCGEIGYFIHPEFWGHGYATEIARTLLGICFKDLNLHRVEARCNSNNASSENVMKKIGMVKEGEFRKVRYKNGHWDNELHYGILVEEWKQRISNEHSTKDR